MLYIYIYKSIIKITILEKAFSFLPETEIEISLSEYLQK